MGESLAIRQSLASTALLRPETHTPRQTPSQLLHNGGSGGFVLHRQLLVKDKIQLLPRLRHCYAPSSLSAAVYLCTNWKSFRMIRCFDDGLRVSTSSTTEYPFVEVMLRDSFAREVSGLRGGSIMCISHPTSHRYSEPPELSFESYCLLEDSFSFNKQPREMKRKTAGRNDQSLPCSSKKGLQGQRRMTRRSWRYHDVSKGDMN